MHPVTLVVRLCTLRLQRHDGAVDSLEVGSAFVPGFAGAVDTFFEAGAAAGGRGWCGVSLSAGAGSGCRG